MVHEVEVDLGEAREMFRGTEAYNNTRGADVIRGMEKALQNLRTALPAAKKPWWKLWQPQPAARPSLRA